MAETMTRRLNGRCIYEVANQLGGYVGPNTEERLAKFLIREAEAAAELADRIEVLEKALEWQPIATVPKDGTPVLALNSRLRGHPPVVVRWKSAGEDAELPEPHWADAATAVGNALYYNGRYFDLWMPIPPHQEP